MAESIVSKEKPTKAKSTTTSTAVKRPAGRPRKTEADKQSQAVMKKVNSAANKRKRAQYDAQAKTRVTVLDAADKPELVIPLPQGVKKLAAAKAQKPAPKRPLGSHAPKKPAVNVAQLEKSLKEAVTAKAASDARNKELESQLAEERTENTRLQRTIKRLREVIADYKSKEVKPSRLRRFFGAKS